jgi:hypothetical protein
MSIANINIIKSNILFDPIKISSLYQNIPDISLNINTSGTNPYTYTITINNYSQPLLGYDLSGFTIEPIYNDINNSSVNIIIDFFNMDIPISKNAFDLPINNNVIIENYPFLYTNHLTSTENLFRNLIKMDISINIINNWNLSNVTNVNNMFNNNILLNQSFEDFDISNITTMVGFLDNTSLSIQNYNKTLAGWYNQENKNYDVVVGVKNLKYDNNGKVYRDLLVSNYRWSFIGDIGPPEPFVCNRYAKGIPLLFNSHNNFKQQSSRMRLAQRLKYNKNLR